MNYFNDVKIWIRAALTVILLFIFMAIRNFVGFENLVMVVLAILFASSIVPNRD